MLEHTFCHIHGIGKKTEALFWQSGIRCWSDWHETTAVPLPRHARAEILPALELSFHALQQSNPVFFADRLAGGDLWRLFSHFRHSTAYLDIETTGLLENAQITTIALYDGIDVFHYVNGENLEDFIEDIMRYTVLVSYNGKNFDIPIIENYFQVRLPQAHIDLRFVLARLGFKGGLKGCEKQLGINRGMLDGVDGFFAVQLWRRYEDYRDKRALQTLLAYNIEDTINLERLMVEAWNRNAAQTPFGDNLLLPYPEPPQVRFQPDLDCIAAIKQTLY